MAPHGQIRLQQDAEITHRGRRPNQVPGDTQRASFEMETPSASRVPREVRLLGVEPQSIGPHPFGDPLNTKLHSPPPLLYDFDGATTCRAESDRRKVGYRPRRAASSTTSAVCRNSSDLSRSPIRDAAKERTDG